jgi:hypothetical protein
MFLFVLIFTVVMNSQQQFLLDGVLSNFQGRLANGKATFVSASMIVLTSVVCVCSNGASPDT